jgi:hypothetical protein
MRNFLVVAAIALTAWVGFRYYKSTNMTPRPHASELSAARSYAAVQLAYASHMTEANRLPVEEAAHQGPLDFTNLITKALLVTPAEEQEPPLAIQPKDTLNTTLVAQQIPQCEGLQCRPKARPKLFRKAPVAPDAEPQVPLTYSDDTVTTVQKVYRPTVIAYSTCPCISAAPVLLPHSTPPAGAAVIQRWVWRGPVRRLWRWRRSCRSGC